MVRQTSTEIIQEKEIIMLSVHGIIAIMSEPEEIKINNGTFFKFKAISADHKTNNYHHYNASVYISDKDLEIARENLQLKKIIHITHGNWKAEEYTKDGQTYVSNFLSLSWNQIVVLGWFSNRK
jgi:hypothetical protein